MSDCTHRVLVVDSFHHDGAFVSCLGCRGNMLLPKGEVAERLPFCYTSPEGKDEDIYILILKGDVCKG